MSDPTRVLTVNTSSYEVERIVIGRAGRQGVDFGLDDEYVSNRHVVISKNAVGVVFVEDLGSTNGSYFNGRKLMADKVIVRAPGGLLRIGHTDIEIKLVDDWLSKVTSTTVPRHND